MPTDIKELFKKAYDKYSGILYSLAIKMSPTPEHAQQMLTDTFIKACKLKLFNNQDKPIFNELIKLMIKTASQNTQKQKAARLTLFTETPLLLEILNDENNRALENLCFKKNLKRCEALKELRKEFNFLRGNKDESA